LQGAANVIVATESQLAKISGFLDELRCPQTGARLAIEGDRLATLDGQYHYHLNPSGIPLFAERFISPEANIQRHHYNKIVTAYTANLEYAHTREYLRYLDRVMRQVVGNGELGTVVELCCGRGEGLTLFGTQVHRYIGVDVSENMLQVAQEVHDRPNAIVVQGDVTRAPLASESIDTVLTLGGIHHVPARAQLFAEIARILKPEGRFIYREPVSDFFLWRALRAIVYRFLPALECSTERPLLYKETVPVLEAAGLQPLVYETHGFVGFCIFMNSDVLVFNRLFRFIPGIRAITRASARLDEAVLSLPGFRRAGLQVVGIAQKPPQATRR
jgi:ubiquinone/menaquinone biosynthesis C-methylase UbiE